MILTEKELKTCLIFALKPILKQYSVYIKEAHLSIDDVIHIQAVILYQDHNLDLNASFTIDYRDRKLYFEHINGKVEYLFLQLNVMSVLQQLIRDNQASFGTNTCYYECDLPIEKLYIENEHLHVQLKG